MGSGLQIVASVMAGIVSLVVTGSWGGSWEEIINERFLADEKTVVEVTAESENDGPPTVTIETNGVAETITPKPTAQPTTEPETEENEVNDGCNDEDNKIHVEINGEVQEVCDDGGPPDGEASDGSYEFSYDSEDGSVRVRSRQEVNSSSSVNSSTKVNVSTQ